MSVLLFTAIFVLLYLLIRKYRNRQISAKLSQFDGPTTLEWVKVYIATRGSAPECFRIMLEWMKKYGPCFATNWFMDTVVCSCRREDVQMLFKLSHKGRVYKFLQSSLGAGLLTSDGEKWKKSRVIMDSVFAAKELSTNLLQVLNEQSRLSVKEMEEKRLEAKFNIFSFLTKALTRTMLDITVGLPKTNDLHLNEEFGSGNRKAEKLIMKRIYSPWMYPDFMFKLYLFLTKQSKLFESVRKPFLMAIKKRKQLCLEKGNSELETSPSSRTLILDILMKNNLTDEELNDEIMTLMFAGVETTTTSICFTLLMLAKNPEIQEKVVEELNAVFSGNKDEPAEASDLAKLTFLEQCIKESLRKLSIVPFVLRYTKTNVTLSDGRVIPPGAGFLLSIHSIHNNPQNYPNPDIWNPHNFDAEKVAQRPTNTFIPFALGLRQCVGYKFAMISMKLFLSTILRNYKVTTDQTEVRLDYYVLVRCRNGYPLKFEKREVEESM